MENQDYCLVSFCFHLDYKCDSQFGNMFSNSKVDIFFGLIEFRNLGFNRLKNAFDNHDKQHIFENNII